VLSPPRRSSITEVDAALGEYLAGMHHRYQASLAHHHCDNATTTATTAAAAGAVGTDDPGSDVDMNCAA
jgi:hypothetical protein